MSQSKRAADLYTKWLGVPPGPRPPKPHEILLLPEDCRDNATIEAAAHAQLAKLDRFALHRDEALRQKCHELMTAVAKARSVLCAPTPEATTLEVAAAAPGSMPIPEAVHHRLNPDAKPTEPASSAPAEQSVATPVNAADGPKRSSLWPHALAAAVLVVAGIATGWLVLSRGQPSTGSTQVAGGPSEVVQLPTTHQPVSPSPPPLLPQAKPPAPNALESSPDPTPPPEPASQKENPTTVVKGNPDPLPQPSTTFPGGVAAEVVDPKSPATLPTAMPKLLAAPFSAVRAKEYQQQWADALGVKVKVKNSIGVELVLIPPGIFLMGTPAEEKGRGDDEAVRKVILTRVFYMSTTEITQAQWKTVMVENQSYFKGDNLPMTQINWLSCQEFIGRLNGLEAEQKNRRRYRLPTEAEWEYACRAGTTSPFQTGTTISVDEANYDGNYVYGEGRKGLYRKKPTDVASFNANTWGLYDMHGNTWEWCQDWYGKYDPTEQLNPTGPITGRARVLRGGAWDSTPAACRSGFRFRNQPENSNIGGLRLVLEIEQPTSRQSDSQSPLDTAKSSRISELLALARANDSRENGRKALAALDELLGLDPGNTAAMALRQRIARNYELDLLAAPFDAKRAKEYQQQWADALGVKLKVRNSVGCEFVLIPAGTFTMGTSVRELLRHGDEGPQRKVTLTESFYMATTELTQMQWRAVMGKNPSQSAGLNLPVERVSWQECQKFIEKLNSLEAERKSGRRYRLPTEAEWEYACRAGTTTPFNTGQTIGTNEANYHGGYTYGVGRTGEYRQRTVPVGSFAPNAWGLFEMHGNVWEWCSDWYGPYEAQDQQNPTGPVNGKYRVLRGGSWNDLPRYCRSGYRNKYVPTYREFNAGFRLVLDTK